MVTVAPHDVRPGRAVELGLLVLALALGVGAYALVGLNVTGVLPANIVRYGAGMAVLAVVVHLGPGVRVPYPGPVILPAAVALNGIGLAMIFRLDLGEPPPAT